MMVFAVGNRFYKLITVLSIIGEYPMCSMELFGNKREYKKVVHNLTITQTIKNAATKKELTCKVLNVSGKGKLKTIRLNKNALEILNWLDERALDYYLAAFDNHRFSGMEGHIRRNHRVAESICLFMTSGAKVIPYELYPLQNRELKRVLPEPPSFYLARDIKRIGGNEMNKTMFTRLTGALFSYGRCYAVYNTKDSVMKWSGMGEIKTINNLTEICRYNSDIKSVDSAILMSDSFDKALNTILESEKKRKYEFRFDAVYEHIFYIPLNEYGIRQLKMMLQPNWDNRLLHILFGDTYVRPEERVFAYDAHINNKYILSFLDGDLASLIRFKETAEIDKRKSYEVVCYSHQFDDVKKFVGDIIVCNVIDLEKVEEKMIMYL